MASRRPQAPRALLLAAWVATAACAQEARPLAEDPVLEARVKDIAADLRCLVCQNESLAASQTALAVDLRRQIGEQLARDRSAAEIRAYMVERYGDFVLLRPRFGLSTLLLWLGPFALLLAAAGAMAHAIARHRPASGPSSVEPTIGDDEIPDGSRPRA